jgi:hypothetical protein
VKEYYRFKLLLHSFRLILFVLCSRIEPENHLFFPGLHLYKIKYGNNNGPLDLQRQESFEELQQLFVDMFQSDIDSGFCNGSAKDQFDPFQRQTRTSSTSPSSSPSPPPPLATEVDVPSCNGINKRGSSAMGSGKPPRAGDVGAGHAQPEFCFGVSILQFSIHF